MTKLFTLHSCLQSDNPSLCFFYLKASNCTFVNSADYTALCAHFKQANNFNYIFIQRKSQVFNINKIMVFK